jgi:4-amino-4-deoxy-L-arabinose transferase-like glycosyltransferase
MRKFWQKWRREILMGFGIIVLAVVLRLINLNSLPVFADEAIYVRWALVMKENAVFRFLPLTDGKQPLYMWVVIPFLKIFSNPFIAARFVSAMSGLVTLVGVFVLTYLIFNSAKVCLVAGLIYAISPFTVFFDRMALAGAMLTMFGVWTLILTAITVKRLRLDTAMLAGFALGGALLTKSPAIFFVLLLPSTILLVKWPKENRDKALYLGKAVFLWGVTITIAYGFYNILRLGPEFHMLAIRNKDYVYPLSHILTSPLDPLLPYLNRSIEWLWALGPSVLVVLFLSGAVLNLKKYFKEIILLVGWGIGPILVQAEFANVFTARYILFTLPYFCILAASAFLVKKESLKRIVVAGLIIFAIHGLSIDYLFLTQIEEAPLPEGERSGYLEEWTAGQGIYEVSELLREERRREPEGQMIVGTEGYFGTLPDALQAYLYDVKEIKVMGVGVNISDVPQQLLDSKKVGDRTYLVVNSTRFSGNAENLGLKLLAAYPKAVRLDGSREALLFFEVTEEAINNNL